MEVRLNRLFGKTPTPLGIIDEEVPSVWRVDVYDDKFTQRPLLLDVGMLHVGMIGRQDGANFCANNSFDMFSKSQQDEIVAEVKRLHGTASPEPPVELPEEIITEDDDEFDDADTDVIDE